MLKANEHLVLACDTRTIPRDMYPSIIKAVEGMFLDCEESDIDKARTVGAMWGASSPDGKAYTGLVFVVQDPSRVSFRQSASE